MKLSSHCFDKSADFLCKCQNKWKITPNSCVLLRKAELYLLFESTEFYNLFLFFVFKEDLAHWQTVFFIAAAVYAIGNVLYCLMASGEEQPWNRVEDSDTTSTANVGPIISAEDLIDNVY